MSIINWQCSTGERVEAIMISLPGLHHHRLVRHHHHYHHLRLARCPSSIRIINRFIFSSLPIPFKYLFDFPFLFLIFVISHWLYFFVFLFWSILPNVPICPNKVIRTCSNLCLLGQPQCHVYRGYACVQVHDLEKKKKRKTFWHKSSFWLLVTFLLPRLSTTTKVLRQQPKGEFFYFFFIPSLSHHPKPLRERKRTQMMMTLVDCNRCYSL